MDPVEISRRLAGGAGAALFDSGVYGSALFLVTRVWVIVAPRCGRRWARRVMPIGLPALVLGSFAGQWLVAPFDGGHEAFGFTCFVLAALLLPIWLLALAGRGIVDRAGHVQRSARPERPWEPFGLVAVTLLIALGLWAFQVVEAGAEARTAKDSAESLRKMVGALQVVERRGEEFEREARLLAQKLAILESILPPTLGVPAFMDSFRATTHSLGAEIGDFNVQEDASGAVHRAEIVVPLLGRNEAVEALRVRTHRMTRLVDWRQRSTDGLRTVVVLTVYAYPGRGGQAASRPCPPERTQVWMWPYPSRLTAVRDQWAGLCMTLQQMRATQARVDEHEAARLRFQVLVDEIERRRAAQGPLEEDRP